MRIQLSLVFFHTIIWMGVSHGQLLYTLISPNEVVSGDFGQSVSGAGNVNNDGYSDLVVGASREGTVPIPGGRAHIFNGRTGLLLRTLISPNAEPNGLFGCSVSGAGDVNNDGYDDIIVGAEWEDPDQSPSNAGRAYVFNGQTGAVLYQLASPNEESSGQFGNCVSGAGDVDDDGYDDVIVGAVFEDTSEVNAGRAYVFSGRTGSLLHTLISPNAGYQGRFSFSVSGAGDLDNDGHHDLIVGAYGEDPAPSPGGAGRAYVFSGASGDTLYTLMSPNEEASGRFGVSVSGGSDVNDDDNLDVIVGAYMEDPGSSPYNAGRAYIFDGETGGLLYTLVSPGEENGGYFGYSVSMTSDVDGDGYGDVTVGAPREGPDDEGRVYFVDGATATLISPNPEADGQFGFSVSGAGDVNRDGYADVIVGAYQEDPGDSPLDAGRAYVFSPGVVILSCYLDGGSLMLEWTPWMFTPAVAAYWVYGAANSVYFAPGTAPPYEHRVATLPVTATSWSSIAGIGDPNNNWTYLIIAVDQIGQEIYRSNRVGEWDFEAEIP